MKQHFSTLLSFLVLCLILNSGCKTDPKTTVVPKTPEEPVVKRNIKIPAFSGDSAYAHVVKQVNFGPRIAGAAGHQKTRDYIMATLKRYGMEVKEQAFDTKFYTGEKVKGYNLIGSFNPDAKKRIFLCAHYDTRPIADSDFADPAKRNTPIPGADDGGSGVGALLEIARLLSENPFPEMGVDFVFFDLEDNGNPEGTTQEDAYSWGLGSQYWAGSPHVSGYAPKFGILLDMVGAKDAVFGREQYSYQYAGHVQNKIWGLAKKMGKGERFVEANIGFATDDHFFVNTIAGWPTVDIIYRPIGENLPFGKHWHTHNDDIDIISEETLQVVGQVVTASVYREAGNMF